MTKYRNSRWKCGLVEPSSLANVASVWGTPIDVRALLSCLARRKTSVDLVPSTVTTETPYCELMRFRILKVSQCAPSCIAALKSSAKSEDSVSTILDTIVNPARTPLSKRASSFFCDPVRRRGSLSFRSFSRPDCNRRLSFRSSSKWPSASAARFCCFANSVDTRSCSTFAAASLMLDIRSCTTAKSFARELAFLCATKMAAPVNAVRNSATRTALFQKSTF
jgi:hypothetical protein